MIVEYITPLEFWFIKQGLSACVDLFAVNCFWDAATMDTARSYIVTAVGDVRLVQ